MSEKIYINNDWLFTEKFDEEFLSGSDKNTVEVELPHSVKETPFDYFSEDIYQMVSGYRKKIKVLKDWAGKSVRLFFDGVAHDATVYINGKERKHHACGYTRFGVDLTEDVAEAKEIEVTVRVDSRENLNQPPFGYVIDYMTYGGIYRDVYLEVSEKTYIKNIFIYPKFTASGMLINSDIRVSNPENKTLTVVQTVGSNTYKKEFISHGGIGVIDYSISYEGKNIERWDVENPVLYTVNTKLLDSKGNVVDENETVTGFRESEFKKDGYYLNGRKVKIRGLDRHQSYAYVGYAMPESMQKLDADIMKKELGLNAVRTSHYPQSHDFISRCDELGILVFTEIPGWQHIGDDDWKDISVKNVKDMVVEYRNHPSIILWGVRINESPDDDEFYERTNEEAHKYDPTRQTGGVRCFKKSHLLEDVYTYNDFVHAGDNQGCDKKSIVTPDMNKGYLVTEYCGHMFPTKPFDCEEHLREHAIRHATVINAIAGHDDISGAFGWCLFDYNTHKDFGSGDRICYHGVLDMFRNPKQAAYVYAAEGADDVVLKLSSSMDIGEHPGCNRGRTWIYSNADSVKMYKNGKLLKEYFPKDSPFKNLKHGPIMINDYVGDAILEGENYSPKLAADIKKIMNAVSLYGMSKLPLRIWAIAGKAILFHHVKMSDAISLYNKYVGDWGGSEHTYQFEAIKDGKVVKRLVKCAPNETKLIAGADHTDLHVTKSYDVALVRIEAVDENGNRLAFFNEPVSLSAEGGISIIGPEVISLKGGIFGTYVKTNGKGKTGKLTLSSAQCDSLTINFTID